MSLRQIYNEPAPISFQTCAKIILGLWEKLFCPVLYYYLVKDFGFSGNIL
jgi:hypothetical protein